MVGTNISEEVESGKLFDNIDLLLDFENEDIGDGLFGCGAVDSDSFPPVWVEESSASFCGSCSNDRSDLPIDDDSGRYDIVQLEWVSNFVQDSLSKVKSNPICHAKRARSKRSRPGTFIPRGAIQLIPPSYHPDKGADKNPLRKCTHCQVSKSPLWRGGPDGPNTLCNACGIRYRSGRLLPDYRPIASPTFNHSLHSNSHRKLNKLRTLQSKVKPKKEVLPICSGFEEETDNKENNRSLRLNSQMRNQQSEKIQKVEILPFSSGFGGESDIKDNNQSSHLECQWNVVQMWNHQPEKKQKMEILPFSSGFGGETNNKDSNRSLHLDFQQKVVQMRNQQPEKKQNMKIRPFTSGFDGQTDNKVKDQSLNLNPQGKVIQMGNQQPKKKPKMKFLTFSTGYDGVTDNQDNGLKKSPPRKCTHCQMTETSQWRIGPYGSNTLCNPCGLRYGSGRLFPEYKPLASPTFVPSLHSNYHRKVTTMRESKNE